MITLYVAMSLDGYLAGEHDELAFLHEPGPGGEDGDYGYKAFYRTVDCVVMGRRTWSAVKGFTPFPYADKECVVITRNPTLEAVANETFSPFDAKYWRARGEREHVYLSGGGVLVAEFMRHGLVDRLELATIPVLLGAGQALFPRGIPRTHFALDKVRGHASGITQASYRLRRP
jgi:dihydrofolate reductase